MRHKQQSKRKGKATWDKSKVVRSCHLFLQHLFTSGLLAVFLIQLFFTSI